MLSRFKNGFLLLMVLLVFGASSQSAVCEVACASQAGQSCCQDGAVAGSGTMAGAECSGPMSSMVGMAAHFRGESSCTYSLVLAVERNASASTRFGDVQWTVVEVFPVGGVIHANERVSRQSPPLRRHWTDPLVVSLRV